MRRTLAAGRSMYHARIDALFALMAHISDTNVYYRGGAQGASMVKWQAADFIEMGGTAHPGWRHYALECHRALVAQKLSPGGAADLLAATCLVHAISSGALS
jgi:triphosphoribosyl-dephospho-CoA synthase